MTYLVCGKQQKRNGNSFTKQNVNQDWFYPKKNFKITAD